MTGGETRPSSDHTVRHILFADQHYGSGVGILVAAGAGAAIGGGTNMVITAYKQDEFNTNEFLFDSAIGGVTGAATFGAGPIASAAINGTAGAVQYGGDSLIEGEEPTLGGGAIAFGAGVVSGVISGGINRHAAEFTEDASLKVHENVRWPWMTGRNSIGNMSETVADNFITQGINSIPRGIAAAGGGRFLH